MTIYVEKILDLSTGKETIREYTEQEILDSQNEESRLKTEQAAKDAERSARDAAKQAVLDKLGLSADEVAALLG